MNVSTSTQVEPAPQRGGLADSYAQLSAAHAERADARMALLAMWASDVEVLHRLLWENGIGEAPDLLASLAGVGEAVVGSLSVTASTAEDGTSARQAVERARAAMVATFDESVHELLSDRFLPLAHLDGLPAHTAAAVQSSVEGRLAGRTPSELVADLRDTAADCMAIAEVMILEGDTAGALNQASQADVASFEAYLVTAALRAGDTSLASVSLRWDLAEATASDGRAQSDDFAEAVTARRERLLALVGAADTEGLRAAFEPIPAR